MNNADFGKTIKNVKKHIDIKLSQQKKERVIQYQIQIIILQNLFTENLLKIEVKKKNLNTYE